MKRKVIPAKSPTFSVLDNEVKLKMLQRKLH